MRWLAKEIKELGNLSEKESMGLSFKLRRNRSTWVVIAGIFAGLGLLVGYSNCAKFAPVSVGIGLDSLQEPRLPGERDPLPNPSLSQNGSPSMGPSPQQSPSPSSSPSSSPEPTGVASVSLIGCSSGGGSCAEITLATGEKSQVRLGDETYQVISADFMGRMNGGTFGYYFFYVYTWDPATQKSRAHLKVVDLDRRTLVSWVSVPEDYTIHDSYFSVVRDGQKRLFPFLAPGGRYMNVSHWSFLCIFDPAKIASPDPSCGTGFKSYSVTFQAPDGSTEITGSGYRHNGGWVEDINGDQIEDIHLPYLRYILSLSGATGSRLALIHFDVAKTQEPSSPSFFHSGRFYGSFKSFKRPSDGKPVVLISAGNAVGTFSDYNCNVSRYYALFEWNVSEPLKWSQFLSFSKTIFNSPYNSTSNYSRLGNDLHNCAHRFSDSLTWAGGQPMVLYSIFHKTNSAPDCQVELLEEQRSGFGSAQVAAYNECAKTNIPAAKGTWTVQALRAENGTTVIEWPKAYLWGRVKNFVPDEAESFVLQNYWGNDGEVRFDQSGQSVDGVTVVSLQTNLQWKTLGTMVNPGSRPKLEPISNSNYYGLMPSGLGHSWGGIPELVTSDRDRDGLIDFQLEDGSWVGYSKSENKLVKK